MNGYLRDRPNLQRVQIRRLRRARIRRRRRQLPVGDEEGMDVDTFIRDVLQPYLCGQSASDVAKVTDVCTEQWEKAARMQIESQMPNEYELKADSAK